MTVARVRVPKQVGRYQLIYELGASYLGPLWAARVEGGDTLALLRLVSLARLDADARVRLLEAAWQAMEVRDDRVLPVTDVVASDGELSVVSEYAEGIPLRAAQTLASVRRKPMSVPVALRFILDLTDGAIALHRAMKELGDEAVPLFGGISTDSILVTADGRASLLDVAISSAASGVDALGKVPERVAYAAPEQLGDQPRSDARTDVFSVGTLAWELLANRRLFVGSDKAVAQKVLAAKVPKLEDAARKGEFQVPPRLGAAVLRALSLDPGARFESMEAFRSELDAAGVAPADPAAVASYVVAIADGAFARTREALSLPPRQAVPRAVEEEKPSQPRAIDEAKKQEAARAQLERKPSSTMLAAARPAEPKPGPVRPVSHAKLAMPARPNVVARPTGARLARPNIEAKKPALSNVEAKAEPSPAVEPKREPQPSPEPKPEVRRSIERKLVARPDIEPKPAVLPSIEPKLEPPPSVITSKRVSIEPKGGDGWRALDAPPSTRSVQPAKVRPRQQTMIGLPAPAGLAPEATPAPPMTEPPPSSSEEPTATYSREHLKQLAERQTTPSAPPPPEAVAGTTPEIVSDMPPDVESIPSLAAEPESAPAKLVSEPPPPLFDTKPPGANAEQTQPARDAALPRLVSLRPTPRALSEIHTERPPPPEPEPTPPTPHAAPGFPSVAREIALEATSPRASAGLPQAPEELEAVRVPPAPAPARFDAHGGILTTPFAPSAGAARSVPRTQDSNVQPTGQRSPDRPAFSRPPPATVAASIYPSQVAPALIHDPRANRAPSLAPAPAQRPARGIVLGVVASLSLVAISATIALAVIRHRGDAATREDHGSTSSRSDALTRTETPGAPAAPATEAASAEPAPSTNQTAHAETAPPAPSATEAERPERAPEPAASAAQVVADNPEASPSPPPTPSADGSGNATTTSITPRAPTHAAAPHPPRATKKPGKKRFVPSDI